MSTHARLYMLLKDKNGDPVIGDVLDRDFKAHIEIENWDWRLTRPDRDKGAIAGDALPVTSVFRFSKAMDRATTGMLNHLAANSELTAEVTLVQERDRTFKFVAVLDKVRISGYSLKAQDEEATTTIEEDWVFEYEEIRIDHDPAIEGMKKALTTKHVRARDTKDMERPSETAFEKFKQLGRPEQVEVQARITEYMKAPPPPVVKDVPGKNVVH